MDVSVEGEVGVGACTRLFSAASRLLRSALRVRYLSTLRRTRAKPLVRDGVVLERLRDEGADGVELTASQSYCFLVFGDLASQPLAAGGKSIARNAKEASHPGEGSADDHANPCEGGGQAGS